MGEKCFLNGDCRGEELELDVWDKEVIVLMASSGDFEVFRDLEFCPIRLGLELIGWLCGVRIGWLYWVIIRLSTHSLVFALLIEKQTRIILLLKLMELRF